MKEPRQKLLSLLNTCADNRDDSVRLLHLANIIQSDDYQELANHHAFRVEYSSEWTVSQLEHLNSEELKKKESDIHNLAKMLRLLEKSICFGNAPSLTNYDFVSFKNSPLIAKLIGKISVSDHQKNYSNIDSRHLLAIFDSSTIKSAKVCLRMLPLSVAKKAAISEADIRAAMGTRLYCINIEEFQNAHRELKIYANNTAAAIQEEKQRRRKHRLFKVAVVMTMFLICFACDQFSFFSEAYANTFSVITFFTSILYLIGG